MKKFYFTALCLSLGAGSAFAQSQYGGALEFKKEPRAYVGDHVDAPRPDMTPQGGARIEPFWTEDFSGGMPTDWTNVDEMTPVGAPNVTFQWSDDPTAVTVASLNWMPILNFNSTGATNGYLWANSDRGLTAAPPENHLTRLTTTPIDCSGQPTVLLTFQSTIGVFDNNANEFVKVRVSTDLTNWTDFFPFPCLVTTGTPLPPCIRFSANPQMVELDITSAAGGQPNVYLQFEWQGGWEYYWAIDELALSPVPEYSRVLTKTNVSHYGDSVQFGRIPLSQFGPEIMIGGEVKNNGLNPQTNVTVNAVIAGPGGSPTFNASQTFGSLAPGEIQIMAQMVAVPSDMVEGDYTVDYSITSDQDDVEENMDDDMATRHFKVQNDMYALDAVGVNPTALTSTMGTSSFTEPQTQDGIQLLSFYGLNSTATVLSLEALIGGGTVAGSSVVMTIHHADEILNNNNISSAISETELIEITDAHITAGSVVIPLSSPVELAPGEYMVGIELFSNAGANHIRIVDDVSVLQPSFAGVIWWPVQGEEEIVGNGNAFALRMILDPAVSVSEQQLTGVSIFPNPTNGLLNIRLEDNSAYDLEVFNLIGERFHTGRIVNNAVLDLSDLAQGVYMVRIANEQGSHVQRVILH